MADTKENKGETTQTPAGKTIDVIANPQNAIPKFSTNVNFNKLPNGDVIMAFMTVPSEGASAVLIETVIVDNDHAGRIAEVLKRVLERD